MWIFSTFYPKTKKNSVASCSKLHFGAVFCLREINEP